MAKKLPDVKYYSQTDRKGNAGVLLEWGALAGNLSPNEARTLGLGLIAAAGEAEADAALLLFLIDGGSEPATAEAVVENSARKRRAIRKAQLALENGEGVMGEGDTQ